MKACKTKWYNYNFMSYFLAEPPISFIKTNKGLQGRVMPLYPEILQIQKK